MTRERESASPSAHALYEAKDMLDIFQDFLEALQFQDAEYALKITRRLKRTLERQGIKTEDFKQGTNDSHFEFQLDDNPESVDYMTTRYALLSQDGKLLSPGTVLEPAKKRDPE